MGGNETREAKGKAHIGQEMETQRSTKAGDLGAVLGSKLDMEMQQNLAVQKVNAIWNSMCQDSHHRAGMEPITQLEV